VISPEGVRKHPDLSNHMWQAKSCPCFVCGTWPLIRACNRPASARLHLIGAFGGWSPF